MLRNANPSDEQIAKLEIQMLERDGRLAKQMKKYVDDKFEELRCLVNKGQEGNSL